MATLVSTIIQRAKDVLMEVSVDGVRWQNDELMRWLNESYEAIVALRPDASPVNEEITLAAGTKQTIPAGGVRLLEVMRNTTPGSRMGAVRQIDRKKLDWGRPNWHGQAPSPDTEFFTFEENDPRTFYVYPPAEATNTLEIVYSVVPEPHGDYDTSATDMVKIGDQFTPCIVDYILHRAFAKDNDAPNAAQRSANHYQLFMQAMTGKAQAAMNASPNMDDAKPRG